MRTLFRPAALAFLVAPIGAVACAGAGGPNGGASHLPNRGIVPWTRFVPSADPAAPPYVAAPSDASTSWHAPAALVVDGGVRLYVEVRGANDTHQVAVIQSDAAGESFGTPTISLAAEASAPSVTRADDGTFWMAYVDGAGDVALATSPDGTTFTPHATTTIAASAPSLVHDGTGFVLYATIDGHIVHATAGADLAFSEPAPVLAPGVGCTDAFGKDKACWDSGSIVDADVRIATTPAGRHIFRMMYAANDGGTTHLGFAASFDGVSWERYPFNPVLTTSLAEFAPSAVLADDRYLLYFERSDPPRAGIALAIDAPQAISDRW